MKFTELNLSPALQGAIDQLGFQDCTPVQEQTMPSVLEGKDVAGLAQTGTGKTAAFLLPLMERILRAGAVKRDSERWLRRQRNPGGSVPLSAQEALVRAEMGALKTPRTVTVRPGSPWPIKFSV